MHHYFVLLYYFVLYHIMYIHMYMYVYISASGARCPCGGSLVPGASRPSLRRALPRSRETNTYIYIYIYTYIHTHTSLPAHHLHQ